MAADAQEEAENKGFWGKLVTLGTTLGCLAVTKGAGLGTCVAIGTAAGGVTRIGTDLFDPHEDNVNQYNPGSPDTKWLRNKSAALATELNDSADQLRDWNANEWKADILKQLSDSMQAYSIGSGLNKIGAFESAGAALPDASEVMVDYVDPSTVELAQLPEGFGDVIPDRLPLVKSELLPQAEVFTEKYGMQWLNEEGLGSLFSDTSAGSLQKNIEVKNRLGIDVSKLGVKMPGITNQIDTTNWKDNLIKGYGEDYINPDRSSTIFKVGLPMTWIGGD